MKKLILISLLTLIGTRSYSQLNISHIELNGQKIQVLTAKEGDIYKQGKLSTGEIIKTGCDHGSCYIKIEYKNQVITKLVGDQISDLVIYEYDFGADGDKEIIVINEYSKTAFLYVYSYRQGLIQKLFDKEVQSYKILVKQNYIEYYLPGGLEQIWNYYQGHFWNMTSIKLSDY